MYVMIIFLRSVNYTIQSKNILKNFCKNIVWDIALFLIIFFLIAFIKNKKIF